MGRTVLPYSQVWEEERQRWQKFRRALRREDQVHLDRLFELARLHLQAGVYASNPWPLESLLLSMLLEHQKALSALEERLQRLEQLLRGGPGKPLRKIPPPSPQTPLPTPCRGGPVSALSTHLCWQPRGGATALQFPVRDWGTRERARALCPSPKFLPTTIMKTTGWLFDLYPLQRPHGVVVYHRGGRAAAAGG